MSDEQSAPLHGIRVVELSEGIRAAYAGLLLASLGADVEKVEPPTGDQARQHGPFPPGAEGEVESSALFHALNGGKRSVVCDLADAGDRALLWELLDEADLFLTSFATPELKRLGLDRPPAGCAGELITVSVTPYGDCGTLAGAAGCALTSAAFGAANTVIGLPMEPPLTPPFDLVDYQAGVNAAAAALAALLARQRGHP